MMVRVDQPLLIVDPWRRDAQPTWVTHAGRGGHAGCARSGERLLGGMSVLLIVRFMTAASALLAGCLNR
jgi:hypothetical protein